MIYVIGPNNTAPEGIEVIDTTSRSSNWGRGLSPFFLGPVNLYGNYKSINVENAWQYSKVYEYYTDDNGDPDERYFQWAQDGWNSTKANRYPMGRDAKPLYSYWDGEKLSYVEARKKIYIPLYATAVQKSPAYNQLMNLYKEKGDLCLWSFDAHGLKPGTYNIWDLWNNPDIKMGHAYVIAMLAEGALRMDNINE